MLHATARVVRWSCARFVVARGLGASLPEIGHAAPLPRSRSVVLEVEPEIASAVVAAAVAPAVGMPLVAGAVARYFARARV